MSRDKALDWLREHDPNVKAPGYGNRYAPVPRRTKEVPAAYLDRVDEDGNVEPFDDWYSYRDRYEDSDEGIEDEDGNTYITRPYVPAEMQDEVAALKRALVQTLRDVFRKSLAEGLTAAELDHFARYEARETQQEIAARLGVSQKTVSIRQLRTVPGRRQSPGVGQHPPQDPHAPEGRPRPSHESHRLLERRPRRARRGACRGRRRRSRNRMARGHDRPASAPAGA